MELSSTGSMQLRPCAARHAVLASPDATLTAQLIGIATIFAWVFTASFVVWMVLKMIMGIRVSEEEEYEGMDLVDCGMEAYPEFTGGK